MLRLLVLALVVVALAVGLTTLVDALDATGPIAGLIAGLTILGVANVVDRRLARIWPWD